MDENKRPQGGNVANTIMWKDCPGGAPGAHKLEVIHEGPHSAVTCTNPRCGFTAPSYSWNVRKNPFALVENKQ